MQKINVIFEDQIIPLIDTINIGRDSENDIVINDELISRKHCIIKRNGEASFSIIDNNSANGTYILTSSGDFLDINSQGEEFGNLKKINPFKIFIGKSYELEFHYPELETKKISEKHSAKYIGFIKNPGKLNIENIELMVEIYPNAAAVMLRRKLENLLFDSFFNELTSKLPSEKNELQELIQIASKRISKSEIYKKMHQIRILGNEGAHKGDVNRETVIKCIKIYQEIENAIKQQI
jgi:hypothetical protein